MRQCGAAPAASDRGCRGPQYSLGCESVRTWSRRLSSFASYAVPRPAAHRHHFARSRGLGRMESRWNGPEHGPACHRRLQPTAAPGPGLPQRGQPWSTFFLPRDLRRGTRPTAPVETGTMISPRSVQRKEPVRDGPKSAETMRNFLLISGSLVRVQLREPDVARQLSGLTGFFFPACLVLRWRFRSS